MRAEKPYGKEKRIKRIFRLITCLLLLLLLLTPISDITEGAVEVEIFDPIDEEEYYSAVVYNNMNGLPTSEANDIAETSEGFIWIGSYGGLVRYDGHTFERMDSTRGVASVVSLHVDKEDRLWIGTNDSGLAMMERGEFRKWTEIDGLPSALVSDIEEDESGIIYVGTAAGISMVYPDMTLHEVEDPRIKGAYIEEMALGNDGLLYGFTLERDLFILRNGAVEEYLENNDNRVEGFNWIYPDPDTPGAVYIGTEGSDIYYGNMHGDPEKMEHIDISPLANVSGISRIGDRIWICAQNGIGVLEGNEYMPLTTLPMNNSVEHVIMDYEGNLWFTSSRQGVMKMVKNQFEDIFARYGLPENIVNTTCMLDDTLYIGTDTGLLALGKNGPLSSIPVTSARTASGEEIEAKDLLEMLDGARIRDIFRDSRNRLWFSTWKAQGLVRYDHGEVTIFIEEDGLLSSRLRNVCETADGSSILVACTGGVCEIRGDNVINSFGEDDGISNMEILNVEAAPNGDILLGSDGGGIYVIGEDGLRNIGIRDGLSSGIVMRIKYDPDLEIFWIVTSNSISYMTDDYILTTVQNFPYSNNFDLYKNDNGEMWILSSDGIYILPVEELIQNGEVRPVFYGVANGLPCISTANSYSEHTPEGDLYIAGASGVAKVNMNTTLEEINDLKQAVPFVEADGTFIYPDETGAFTIDSDVRKLTIYGFVFNYSLTDPMVSYRLKGFDRGDTIVKCSDLAPVTYTNLRGGSYRFEMVLMDAFGQKSRVLSVPVVKKKALYERVGFYILIGCAVAFIMFLLIRQYIRRITHEMEEKHREAAEKERITHELRTANEIQEGSLPHEFPPFPDRKEFDIYASMKAAREVGGDFYDFYLVDDDHLCMVIADVSDKGVPAALFMMVSKTTLKNFAAMKLSPAEILTRSNEALCANNQTSMFVTLWLGILEISTGKLVAGNAGHEFPIIKRVDGSFEVFEDNHDIIVGGMEGMKYGEYELQLFPGDKLFVYTDGLPEATNRAQDMFGMERIVSALNGDPKASPKELLDNVHGAVEAFGNGAEQFDDLTMLCLEYRG